MMREFVSLLTLSVTNMTMILAIASAATKTIHNMKGNVSWKAPQQEILNPMKLTRKRTIKQN